jgi:hypothetical protein
MSNAKENIDVVTDLKQIQTKIEEDIKSAKQKERLEVLKKKAIEKQKKFVRNAIKDGRMVLDTNKEKVVQKINLFEWDAPIRKKFLFSKKDFLILVTLTLIFMIYLSILGHYMLMFALAALLFVIYVAGLFEPQIVKHKITTQGIEAFNVLYKWEILDDFYFSKLEDQYFLIVDTNLKVERRLILLINKGDLEPIFILLQDKLLYKAFKNNKMWLGDRLSLGQYIPIEKI